MGNPLITGGVVTPLTKGTLALQIGSTRWPILRLPGENGHLGSPLRRGGDTQGRGRDHQQRVRDRSGSIAR